MNTVIFLLRVSRRIRPAETYRKRLSSTFRYLSEIRKRLFSPCVKVFVLDILSVLTCFEGFMSVPQVTRLPDRIQVKLQLTGKSRLTFQLHSKRNSISPRAHALFSI